MYKIIDAHSHLWLRQDTSWNGKRIKPLPNGRSMFLGEEVQMLPPFMIDGSNTAEVFISNMNYAQVSAAVVVQEFIDGQQNEYLDLVQRQYHDRFFVCGMADYLHPGFYAEAAALIEGGFKGMAIPAHRIITDKKRVMLNSDEMMVGNQRRLYNGSCTVILRAGRTPGKVTLTASSPSLKMVTVKLETR